MSSEVIFQKFSPEIIIIIALNVPDRRRQRQFTEMSMFQRCPLGLRLEKENAEQKLYRKQC
jgi:hypothetical protein